MDDQDLLKRYAKDGDDEAFTTLVERYIGMVYGTARRADARATMNRRRRSLRTSSQSWPGMQTS